MHYDPLLAKVIADAETREAAIARAIAALRSFPSLVSGPTCPSS